MHISTTRSKVSTDTSFAFVYIFIGLFIRTSVLKCICLLSVVGLNSLLGAFLCNFKWIQIVWLTSFSSNFNMNLSPASTPAVRYWSRRGQSQRCVCVSNWWVTVGRPVNRLTDRWTSPGPLQAGHLICVLVNDSLTPERRDQVCCVTPNWLSPPKPFSRPVPGILHTLTLQLQTASYDPCLVFFIGCWCNLDSCCTSSPGSLSFHFIFQR